MYLLPTITYILQSQIVTLKLSSLYNIVYTVIENNYFHSSIIILQLKILIIIYNI